MSREASSVSIEKVVLRQCPREADPEGGTLDLIGLAHLLWLSRRFIIGMSLLAGGLALMAALVAPAYYTVEVVVKSAESSDRVVPGGGGLAAAAGLTLGDRSRLRQLREMLLARQVAYEFLDQPGRMDVLRKHWSDYGENAFVPLPQFLRSFWGGSNPLTKWRAHEKLRGMIKVDIDDNGMVMKISLTMHDADLVADWANAYLKSFNSHYQGVAIAEAEKSLTSLWEEVRRTDSIEMRQVYYRLIEREVEKKVLAKAREDYMLHIVDLAVPPEIKSGPARSLLVILGLLGGMLVAVLVTIARSTVATWRKAAPEGMPAAGPA